jgi:hypothetical protein
MRSNLNFMHLYCHEIFMNLKHFYLHILIWTTAIIFGLKLAFTYIVIGFFHHGTIHILPLHNCGLFLTHLYVNINITLKNI